jgi:nucleoside-triphosphatase THEP1
MDGRKVGMEIEDIRTGQRRCLAEACTDPRPSIRATNGPTTGNWRFHTDGLAWGTTVLRRATPCDLLVIDELGPLELIRGQGWEIGLDVLRAGCYRLALVTVRPSLLSRFQERLEARELVTLTVTRADQGALADQVIALLER